MRLQKRQYVLIVLILVVGTFNLVRVYRSRHQPAAPPQPPVVRGTSPAWAAFDTAASLRDAPPEQFQPALKALQQSIDSTNAVSIPPQTSPGELQDLHGCQTWLLFYRQEHLHPGNKPGWPEQMRQHVDSCVTNHRDIAK